MIAPAVVLALALASAAPDALVIESDSPCPSAEAVRDALAALRPASDWPHTTVAISAQAQSLLVALGSRSASPREIAVGADCAARAATVAVVVATWLSDLPAEPIGSPLLPAPAPIETVTPIAPAPGPGAPPPPRLREIGLGGLAAFGGGTVPGLRLEYVQHVRERRYGWQDSLVLSTPHQAAV